MELNERKTRILEAIIADYTQTAEPIGSRTIAKKYDLGVSSATIRNEMSDLEDMGYIIQPHASSGRIPSDKGYRLYVDKLMRHRELSYEDSEFLYRMIVNNINQIDYLMKETAKAISLLTNYTTIVSEPKTSCTRLRQIQLMPYDENNILMVLITDSKAVKNHVIHINDPPEYERLNSLSSILNKNLSGRSLGDIDSHVRNSLISAFGGDLDMLRAVLGEVESSMCDEDGKALYTSGVRNILGYPEFSNLDRAKELFQTLEEKDMLITILGQGGLVLGEHESGPVRGIRIVIGSENNIVQLKDCSVIKANYTLNGESHGSIGVIGPTRMDYPQTVAVLDGIVRSINLAINKLTGG